MKTKNYKLRIKNLSWAFFFALALILAGCSKENTLINVSVNGDETKVDSLIATSTTKNTNQAIATLENKEANILNRQPTSTESVKKVLAKLELPVLFAQQAPFSNWDALHEEACEEASMIMAARYFLHQPLNESIMEQEIQKLVKWETENGYQVDLTAQEVVDILQKKFSLKANVSTEVTVDRIKYELAQGNLIIVPAAGRELGNPNFKQPGPIYHMLVIKGYNDREFITNDPGTRKGNGWKYRYSQLLNAVHNWDHELAEGGMTDKEMAQGEKVIIIVSK